MDHSTDIELHETTTTQEICVKTTFEYETVEHIPAVTPASRKKMEHNKGKGKAKEEPQEVIELKVRGHQLPGPGGSLPTRSAPRGQKNIYQKPTNMPTTASTQTKSVRWASDHGEYSSEMRGSSKDGRKEEILHEDIYGGIRRLLTGRQQHMVYNRLLVAKLPFYDEVNDFRSTLDMLSNAGGHYYCQNWKLGFKTKLPLQKGFATKASMAAENEYLKKTHRAESKEQIWTEAVKRDKMERRGGLGFFESLNPTVWRSHGKTLKVGQEPPEPSCKIQVETKCGDIVYRWYVKCHREKPFFRRVQDVSICGDDQCNEHLKWNHGDPPIEHKSSLTQWVEVDPDETEPRAKRRIPMNPNLHKEDIEKDKARNAPQDCFPAWMLSWLEKGPPKEDISNCMKVTIMTKCGLVNARLLILCDQHIKCEEHCAGDREYLIIHDYACSLGKDKNRCEVRTWCDSYIQYWKDLQQDSALMPEERKQIAKLITLVTKEYSNEKEQRPFLRHSQSVPVVKGTWVGWMNNTLGYYEMLSLHGLKAINPLARI